MPSKNTNTPTLADITNVCAVLHCTLDDLRSVITPTPKPEQVTSVSITTRRYVSKQEFLQSVPISLSTLDRMIRNKQIQTVKIGARRRLIPVAELNRYTPAV